MALPSQWVGQVHGSKTITTTTLSTTAAKVLSANGARLRATLINTHASIVIYVGGSGVTSATGIPVAAGTSYDDWASNDDWYAVAASGTPVMAVVEVK